MLKRKYCHKCNDYYYNQIDKYSILNHNMCYECHKEYRQEQNSKKLNEDKGEEFDYILEYA